MKPIGRLTASLGLAFLLAAPAAEAGLTRLDMDGVYRLNFDTVDDLLDLQSQRELRVLVVDDKDPQRVSDAHATLTREWVQSGGVLWAVDDGLESELVKSLATFDVRGYEYKKSATGKRGGELIVRGVSPRLRIHDTPLTRGVDQLYLYPKRRFNGTRGAQPVVEMTDGAGNHGLVIVAIPLGKGMVVLDGTARSRKKLPFGRMPGFDPQHPNAVKQDGVWQSYDWERLMRNARAEAEEALGRRR